MLKNIRDFIAGWLEACAKADKRRYPPNFRRINGCLHAYDYNYRAWRKVKFDGENNA